MKSILLNTFFKKELASIHKDFEIELQSRIGLIKKSTQNDINTIKANSEISKRIFFLFEDAEIIGIEENKLGEEVYVFRTQSDSLLNIYLCSQSYKAINGLPRIMAVINKDNVKIEDIQTIDINIGNGKILMEYLISTAKKMEMANITGWLSPEDKGHFDRSEHYYRKFEFDVKLNDSRNSGSIKLKLHWTFGRLCVWKLYWTNEAV